MKTVCIVQARTTSERFPCKIFAALHSKPMLAHVLERAAAIQGVDQVVLAVPENDVRLVAHLWPHVFGGPEKDVLGRYAAAAEQYEADIIIRITGDCPLLAPNLVAPCLIPFIESNLTDPAYFPACQPYAPIADGWDFEIFTYSMLDVANIQANKKQREHVTTWMRENYGIQNTESEENYTALKCSVDMREDLQRVELIMNHLDDKTDFSHTATWTAWEKAGRP